MAVEQWRELSSAFADYQTRLNKIKTQHVNTDEVKVSTKALAQTYFRVEPKLVAHQVAEDVVGSLTTAFETLMKLAEGRNLTSSYKKQTKIIRKCIPKISVSLEIQNASSGGTGATSSSAMDVKIIETLTALVPSASQSYQQAIRDLADHERISFRGPAHELREALREVLDHFAPDDDMKESGVALEKVNGKERAKYTMKQKVRYIFRARERSTTESAVPENAVSTVEALIADMTRSTYDRGALVAHTEADAKRVEQLKRYVDVVFHDLLEL